ncbi:hypothetical protein SLG_12440 [Sphingobium sp. SYK-6]|uniref:CmcJ/NvfI family oxidoreductase n=1 Tax=Sphingobium sp. (strain NBRC 103272 / SYK-6) TaxID=627192 RepID=UPI000227728D|nr:CmcJ/NvfI family oxidoreductase [Sphingobium sp. SYK-6]BAK65919.1 hypothetical protein SLG_12440 [Sphingobium sp. SYK-6]
MARDQLAATIGYLAPDSHINRFYWAPDGRLSTGRFVDVPVTLRNARTATPAPALDTHGFELLHRPSFVADPREAAGPGSAYAEEIVRIVQERTGADLVLPMGAELRSSAGPAGRIQRPAARAHVDFDTPTAHRIAQNRYRRARPDGPPWQRFLILSVWRPLSDPPQDWPLALCDFESTRDDPEIRNVKIDVPALPSDEELSAPIPGEAALGASALFHASPAHRWWWYPDMRREEIILIKFHDSDHRRAWRALHCAFENRTSADAHVRESIEFRAVAYFTGK